MNYELFGAKFGTFENRDYTGLKRIDAGLLCAPMVKSLMKWAFVVWWNRENPDEVALDDGGWRTCELCKEFFDNRCRGCPIFTETGTPSCYATPYSAYCSDEDGCYEEYLGSEIIDVAEAEFYFLYDLCIKYGYGVEAERVREELGLEPPPEPEDDEGFYNDDGDPVPF